MSETFVVSRFWRGPVYVATLVFLTSVAMVTSSGRWDLAAPGVVLAIALFGTRHAFRVDPARGEAAVGIRVLGLDVFTQRRTPLASAREVQVTRVVELVRTRNGVVERTRYPVTIEGEPGLDVWSETGAVPARGLGERIARALRVPFRDASTGAERIRGWEELDLTLGRRLRAAGERPREARLPPGSRIQVRTGPETVIVFPAQAPSWRALLLVGIPVAAVAVVVGFAAGWRWATIPFVFLVLWVVAWIRDLAGYARPTSLRVGRDAVVAHGPFGGESEVALDGLEEVVEDGTALWLLSDQRHVRIPFASEDPAERAYVIGVIERASYDHRSASAGGRAAPAQ